MSFYATIARYYDAEHVDKTDDLAMYSSLADEYGSPIFEFGAGTGRVMLHLAQEGHTIHGIDMEAAMLDRAKRKAEGLPHLKDKLKFFQGDILKYKTDQKYKLALVTYNGLLHFHTQEQQLEVLKQMRALLDDDGALVLDLPNPGDSFAAQDTDALILDKTFIDPETGHLLMQYSVSQLDRTEQLLHVTWIYDEVDGDGIVHRTFAPVIWRYFFYAELRLLLSLTGFEVRDVYGSTDFEPFGDGCERMIVVAKTK
ncbi:MAG: class I SAM-dependent methyltransferase [Chloroflexota bacterium]